MKIEHFRKLLIARRDTLLEDIHRYDSQVLDAQVAEVGDSVDLAVTDQSKSQAADLSSTADAELGLVMDALARIEKGTYGKCIDCGKDIPEARLEAVPWTPYCLEDQEAHDQALGVTKPATL